MVMTDANAEVNRLHAVAAGTARWRRWGPYSRERQWGTVREDYCADGDAWDYFPHDHARSRAYRWGEDGLARHLRPTSSCSASRSRSGTAAIRSSRSGCSA